VTGEPVRPDYGGAWVGAVVPALLDGDGSWLPAGVREARGVCLLVLDGLGWHTLSEHRDQLPTLRSLEGGPIITAAPSTTSAVLTSISTGLPPARHGVVGYRMRVGGEVLNVLRWETRSGQRPEPEEVQPAAAFGGRPVPVVSRAEFADSGFTRAHLRGGRYVGWLTDATRVEWCRRLTADGESFVYAYHDGVDKVAHAHGLEDGFFAVELAAADRLVADLLAALPAGYALVVTADHGQAHVGAKGWVDLDAVAGLVTAWSGEPRFRGLHARPGAAAELWAAAGEEYGDRAWIFSRDELFDEGWLGDGASPAVRGRVGDVVLAARAGSAFAAPDAPNERKLVALHGSLTRAEMVVPLIATTK
jgi:hypothetical protein